MQTPQNLPAFLANYNKVVRFMKRQRARDGQIERERESGAETLSFYRRFEKQDKKTFWDSFKLGVEPSESGSCITVARVFR